MLIYKLTPTEKESDRWDASTDKMDVIIRAENENEAREIAKSEFSKLAKKTSRHADTPLSPWLDPDLVTCERFENSDYEENGPAGVLFPKSNLR